MCSQKWGRFFRLLYQGLEKLPQKIVKAARGVLVDDIPVLQNCFNSPPLVGSKISFWGGFSFFVEDSGQGNLVEQQGRKQLCEVIPHNIFEQ